MSLDPALLSPFLSRMDCPALVLDPEQRVVLHNPMVAALWPTATGVLDGAPPLTTWLGELCAAGALGGAPAETWGARWEGLLADGTAAPLTIPTPGGAVSARAEPLPGGNSLVTLRPAGPARDAGYFRTMVESLQDAVYVCSADHRVEYANPAMQRWIGAQPEGQLCHQAIYGLDGTCPWCAKEEVLARRAPNRMTTESRRDGRLYEITNAPLENPDGTLSKLAIYRDVTAEKGLQVDLEEAREFAESLVKNSAVPTFVLDADHRVSLWNRACAELTGVSAGSVVGTREHWLAFYPEWHRCLADYVLDGETPPAEDTYEQWAPSPLAPGSLRGERWIRRPDGEKRYLAFEAAPIHDRSGEVIAVIETLHDITERRRAEEEARLLSSAVAQAADGIAVTDPRGRIRYTNPAFQRMTGAGEAELEGAELPLPPDGPAARAVREGTPWRGRWETVLQDGSHTHELSVSPVLDESGAVGHQIVVQSDVTQQMELERNLARAQQLEAVGTLASGIAHDFNNLLSGIIGHAEITLDDVAPGSVGADNLKRIVLAGERGQELVGQLLAFGRHSEGELVPVSLAASVEEAVGLLRAALPRGVDLRVHLDAANDTVLADATHLQQALMNLCTNAAHALGGDGGVVELGLEPAAVDQDMAARNPDLHPGEYLRLTISDTGHGISPEVLQHIYEPFFTTKPVGEGTGLGLSATHGIVRAHGGAISVFSTPGEGTTFHLFFPRCHGTVGEGHTEPAVGGERVLFVDDEEDVVELARQILDKAGYRVTATSDSTEALALLQAHPERFDVLVSDHAMPKLTGLELAEAARALRPGLPVVLCSGYAQSRTRERARELGVSRFLLKPITVGALGAAIREALGTEAARPDPN